MAAAFVGVIVDGPTGESWEATVYSPWPLVLLFVGCSGYYWFRAKRPTSRATKPGPALFDQ